jgi:hypothetical protein
MGYHLGYHFRLDFIGSAWTLPDGFADLASASQCKTSVFWKKLEFVGLLWNFYVLATNQGVVGSIPASRTK